MVLVLTMTTPFCQSLHYIGPPFRLYTTSGLARFGFVPCYVSPNWRGVKIIKLNIYSIAGLYLSDCYISPS